MSTNCTNNYNLCQWEASDKVLRTDFNADNAKIDAALAQLNRYTASVEQKTDTLANSAYTIQNPQIVAGHYTGTGTEKQSIQLGFRPRMVLVLHQALKMDSNAYYTCGLAVDGGFSTAVSITSTGFEVYEINEGGTLWRRTNQNGSRFAYFAFK